MNESLEIMGSGASRVPLPNFFVADFLLRPVSIAITPNLDWDCECLGIRGGNGALMGFVDLDGVRLHFELAGSARLPVLVLSNSLGSDLSMWEPQLEALTPHFRVLRYDARGHGNFSVPEGRYTIDDLGGDVVGLLDALGIAQASFCGISMGGVTGQWLAVHAPERLRRLVLANTAAKIGTADGWNARIAAVLADGLSPIVSGTMERWFTAEFRAAYPEVVALTAGTLAATSPQGYAACCAAVRDADFRSTIDAVRTPTLVIAGTHDPATTLGDAQFLCERIEGAHYVELAAAHLSNIEAAGAFNEALLSFLLA